MVAFLKAMARSASFWNLSEVPVWLTAGPDLFNLSPRLDHAPEPVAGFPEFLQLYDAVEDGHQSTLAATSRCQPDSNPWAPLREKALGVGGLSSQ